MNSIAIVVSSCDAFFDAWRPFAFFFRKFWPDCPYPVYLIVNQLRIRSSFIRALPVGIDRGWASNLKAALHSIEAPRVLYLQEDYFLSGPVKTKTLAADLDYAAASDTDAFCFRARSTLESDFKLLTDRFGVVPSESDGRTRCQLTLWKREAFLSALRDGESAWEMEARGSERTRAMKILSYHTRDNSPVPYLMSAIVRGLWTREALRMCAEHHVPIRPHFRGTYSENSLLRKVHHVQTRLLLRRALAQVGHSLDLDAE